jgi:hypothetical protein
MHKLLKFWPCFWSALAAQVVLIPLVIICGHPRWFMNAVGALYFPVSWLSETFITVRSEADAGAGIVFVPPVVLLYAFAFAGLAALIRRIYDA